MTERTIDRGRLAAAGAVIALVAIALTMAVTRGPTGPGFCESAAGIPALESDRAADGAPVGSLRVHARRFRQMADASSDDVAEAAAALAGHQQRLAEAVESDGSTAVDDHLSLGAVVADGAELNDERRTIDRAIARRCGS